MTNSMGSEHWSTEYWILRPFLDSNKNIKLYCKMEKERKKKNLVDKVYIYEKKEKKKNMR
jgi:hypothetical protein